MARWLISFAIALLAVLASFAIILWMISPPQASVENKLVQVGHFIPMSKNTSDAQSRSRLQAPEPPPDVEPPKPQTPQTTQNQAVPTLKLDLAAPKLTSSISIRAHAMPSLDAIEPSTAQTAAPSAPAAPGKDSEVTPLNDVLPEYPDVARRRGIEGYVKLTFTISAHGRVENIEVLEAQPANVFDRSARRAAARWRFTPRMENGIAVPRHVEKIIEFKLEPAR
ncbi:energy transducer TonB [Thiopseudomonas acetoxidans]|uniref:Protein TonB n=1 Tax=Thiopseudomonas acetoxidans TaxID=3041622 RepID=A0ABT7SPA3_9GAMM|nr:energy transducer TonB [Thiopseudomonas sp. CY1220]MDM7858023.1 energy transducer TonB [Thiopseudomonas sp. CY1220]